MAEPKWLKDSLNDTKKHAELFYKNLRELAVVLARHDRDECVLKKHVDSAFVLLSRRGLNRLAWWKRPEAYVTLGGALFGFAFNVSEACSSFGFTLSQEVARSLSAILLISGVLLLAYGWLKGSGLTIK